MARIRSVHPDICTDEVMAELPAEVERTYVRLWTHMDDSGRCIDNVKLIRAAIYPLHDDMTTEVVDKHLDMLVAIGRLDAYEAKGTRCLHVLSWKKYQHPQRPKESAIPVRDGSAMDTRCVKPSLFGSGVGVVDADAQEGRADCTYTYATELPPPAPRRLGDVKTILEKARANER